jgi:hypothetical protein
MDCVKRPSDLSLTLSLDKEREQRESSELCKGLSDKDKVLSDKERRIQIGIVAVVQSSSLASAAINRIFSSIEQTSRHGIASLLLP